MKFIYSINFNKNSLLILSMKFIYLKYYIKIIEI